VQEVYASNDGLYTLSPPSGSLSVHAIDPIGTVNQPPIALITGSNTDFNSSFGIALDASGRIYVCVGSNSSTAPGMFAIFMFAAHPTGVLNEAPLAMITGSNTGLKSFGAYGCAIAVDGTGKIYAVGAAIGNADLSYNSVNVYPANPSGTLNEAPSAMIVGSNTGLHIPSGVALDASGKIYVTNDNPDSITIYAANPSGVLNEAPLATIAGSNTGLIDPQGIAVDSAGRIYVVNDDQLFGGAPPTITVYAANPSGTVNEAPIATIGGSATTLTAMTASAIALDASGRIYVSNNSTITVFAANPTGTLNEAPIGVIGGSKTDVGGAPGIAIH
jgi:hypothetical protein